jgi:hypothetical protein
MIRRFTSGPNPSPRVRDIMSTESSPPSAR